MAKITIEFDDEIMAGFLAQISEQAASATVKGKPGKAAKDEPAAEETEYDAAGIKQLCADLLEATDKATVKEVLKEFDCTTVAKACKLEGDDLQDCGEALTEAIEEAAGGSSSGDDEITVEAVKVAVQAYSKTNGKEATSEILEDFEIKTVRSLNKLSQEDLEELYAEVCE